MSLQALAIAPEFGQPPRGCLVFLHGWGANAQDLVGLVPALGLADYSCWFLEAPFRHPYTMAGRMWYDLESTDWQGLAESKQLVADWLQALPATSGLPLERSILAGFSQGGAMTLEVGLSLPLAGLMSLSGYLHPHLQVLTQRPVAPVLVVHGTQDTVVPVAAAQQIDSVIRRAGGVIESHILPMGHEITPEALAIARAFVLKTLG